MNFTKLSRFLSLVLRHHPEKLGIALDEHGWANVDELLSAWNRQTPVSMQTLEEIVRTDAKGRYSFSEDRTLIRANQGHSIPVDVELEKVEPPEILYHGTGERSVQGIETQGLDPRGRLHVHLSPDAKTAKAVGQRHGKPVVYEVLAGQMARDGYEFFRSVNGVWLTKSVPAKYLRRPQA